MNVKISYHGLLSLIILGENSTDAATEDISIGHGILDSDNILKYSMSYMCMRHLKAIASEQIDCSRHKTYSIPSYLPLHFDLKIGSLIRF